MEQNSTLNYNMNENVTNREEDVRVLATSYIMFKIGKFNHLSLAELDLVPCR